jgi:predicted MFS family arabinose efflux permease
MNSGTGDHFDLKVAIFASAIAGVVNIPFNAMPMILGSAADQFQLIPRQIGLLGGATLAGWVAGTALCFFILHRINWRSVAGAGLLVAVAGIQMSVFSPSLSLLYLSWFILGFGASLPTCVAFEVVALTRNQERAFGILTLAIVLVSAAVLYFFPLLILPRWGYQGLVFGLAVLFLLALAIVWTLPGRALRRPGHEGARTKPSAMAWLAFAGFVIFFAGQSGLWAFLERAGRELLIAPEDIGLILAILKVVGGLASITAMVVAARFGNRWPFFVGVIGTLVAIIVLNGTDSIAGYSIGGWLWEYCFTLVFCYTTAAISRLDQSGRVVVLVPGAIGLAGAIGPSAAGYLKTGPGFLPIYLFALVSMLICACLLIFAQSRSEAEEAVAVQ